MKTFTAVVIFAIIWFVVLVPFGLLMRYDPFAATTIPLFYIIGVALFAGVLLVMKGLNK